ncbi:MAG: hypothetical protein RIQ38_2539 [Pseudomonadota bacterium]|jgi:hypothetical protein
MCAANPLFKNTSITALVTAGARAFTIKTTTITG